MQAQGRLMPPRCHRWSAVAAPLLTVLHSSPPPPPCRGNVQAAAGHGGPAGPFWQPAGAGAAAAPGGWPPPVAPAVQEDVHVRPVEPQTLHTRSRSLPSCVFHVLCRRREELAPFQAAEAIDVRRKSDAFGEKLEAYCAFFLQKAPFAAPDGGNLSLEHVRSWQRGHCQGRGLRCA